MAKYCEEIIVQIESLLSLGVSNIKACEALGITEKTFYQWMKKSKFSQRVKKAKALGQTDLLNKIKAAVPQHWQAAAWMLERIWPDEFGKRVELSGNKDKPIFTNSNIEITRDMDPKEAARRYASIVKGEE